MTGTALPFTVGIGLARNDLPGLCANLARLLGGPGGVVTCDVAGVARPDVGTVEALARLRLTARRHGWQLEISGAGPELAALLGLLGLTDVLLQVRGQPEQREQPPGVQEVVHPRDPPV